MLKLLLEKKAGGKLKTILASLTSNPFKGFALGLVVTSIIQSSSATTVMVVGFVSAGIMTLHQSIYIIMGANVGTTVTAWILSLAGIEGSNVYITMLKPDSFTPIIALIGIILYLFCSSPKKKDTGMILLGFAVLMTGMSGMSDAVSGLKDVPEFANVLLLFSNPLFGVLAGAILTAIIQSSSASVGILQALSSTGAVTYSAAIPIITGQNIGTCVTALIASANTTRDAKRAAMVHLYFNIIGTVVLLSVFYALNAIFKFSFVNTYANELGIAIIHTTFNLLCTAILFPFGRLLEKLACLTVKDRPGKEEQHDDLPMLNDNILAVAPVAVERCRSAVVTMAELSVNAISDSLKMLDSYDEQTAAKIRKEEDTVDKYEDKTGAFLVKISTQELSSEDSFECTKLLHLIGDFERISDHAVNILESAEEMRSKDVKFSPEAQNEIKVISSAVNEITHLTLEAFRTENTDKAASVEPLEQVVDELKEKIRLNHILRLQKNYCTIEHGFILSDILTNLERVADHCSNVAVCILEMTNHSSIESHTYLSGIKTTGEEFRQKFMEYSAKYSL